MDTPTLDKEITIFAEKILDKKISSRTLDRYKKVLFARLSTRLDALGMYAIKTKVVRQTGMRNVLRSFIHFNITDEAIAEIITVLEADNES